MTIERTEIAAMLLQGILSGPMVNEIRETTYAMVNLSAAPAEENEELTVALNETVRKLVCDTAVAYADQLILSLK